MCTWHLDFLPETTTVASESVSVNPGDFHTGYEWFDGITSLATGVSPTITLGVGTHVIDLVVTDANTATGTDQVIVTVNSPGTGSQGIYMSFTGTTTVPGVGVVRDEDIVSYDSVAGVWAMYFDASDVGMSSGDLDAFHVRGDGSVLMSWSSAISVPGLTGGPAGIDVDDSDVFLFTPTSTGDVTAGAFSFFLDGSDIELTTSGEDIAGLFEFADGTLAITTNGTINVTGVASGGDEDVHIFDPVTTGAVTTGTWSTIHFDGSDLGLTNSNDDIRAITFDTNTDMLFATNGTNTTPGSDNEDINRFTGTYGPATTGTTSIEHDLTTLGIDPSQALDGLHVAGPSGPAPPNADAGVDQTLEDSDNGGDEPVTLDGSGSTAGAAAITGYEWFDGTMSLATGVNPTITLDVGTHVIDLVVTDANTETGTDQVIITVDPAAPPNADAGADQTLEDSDEGGDEPVTLDGSGSTPGAAAITGYEWFDGITSLATGVSPTITLGVGTHVIDLVVTDANTATGTDQVIITVNSPGTGNQGIYMSFTGTTTVPGVGVVRDEDIVVYDSVAGTWAMYFDASDVGLTSGDLDAFHVRGDGSVLMSWSSAISVPGLTGGPAGIDVDDSDVFLFTPTSTGDVTAGAFSFFLDGSDIELTTSGEDIAGLFEFADGTLAITTNGTINVTGVASGGDEDVHIFDPVTTGAVTTGTWSTIHFDGSDLGLTNSNDDIRAITFDTNTDMLFATNGTNTTPGSDNEDINRFTGTYGPATTGTTSIEHDLTTLGIDPSQAIDGLHLA